VITTITILLPLLGAILMLFLPDDERLVRYAALVVAAVPLLVVTYIYFAYGDDLGAVSLTQDLTWIESLNVGYRVGLDGLGFGMFFLSALLTVIAVLASWDVQRNLKQYFAALFVAEVGMLGVFAAQDLILRDHAHPDVPAGRYLGGREPQAGGYQVLYLHFPRLDGDARRFSRLRHPRR
jgi:NADH-quinone oxidoreductase subunit M